MPVFTGSNQSSKRYAGSQEIVKRYQGANLIWEKAATLVMAAPVTSAMAAKNVLTAGFDRLVEGYQGNTVRLRNNDTLAEQDFGATASGLFNVSGALAFAQNSDVVKFYAQDASGKELTPSGTVAFARSGVIQRQQIEATLSGASAGFITPDNTKGVVACDISNTGTNFLECTNSAIPPQCEVHVLHAHKTRKLTASGADREAWGGNATTEAIVSIGTAGSSANFVTYQTNRQTGGTLFIRRVASNVSTSNLPKFISPLKQWAPIVSTFKLASDKTILYVNGDRSGDEEGTTGASVDADGIATGGATAGDNAVTRQYLRIGRQLNGPVGEAGTQANILFSGIIVTQPLTDRERLTLHANWAQMCQAHVYEASSYAHDLFQDYILFGKAASGATPLAGEKGLFSIQFNTSTYNSETPSWGYGHVTASGLKGVRNQLLDSRANQFEDVSATKPGGQNRTLTIVSVVQNHSSINSGSDLLDMFAYGSGAAMRPLGQQMTGLDLQVAKDHNAFSFNTVAAKAGFDPNDLTGRPGPTDPHCVNSTPTLYNGVNHPFFYRKKTMHRFISAETDTAYTCNTGTTLASAKAWMATEGEELHSQQGEYGANLNLDPGRTYLMIQRIQPHPNFVESGSQTEIDEYMRNATKSSIIVPLNGACIGFFEGFHAMETLGATRVPETGSRLVAHGDDYRNFAGTRIMLGVIPAYVPDADIPKLVTSVRQLVNEVT